MRTSVLFGAKNFGLFEIYGVSARTRRERVESVRTFCGQGGGSIFRDFVRTSFMDGPKREVACQDADCLLELITKFLKVF